MDVYQLSNVKRLAIALDAPINVTGSDPDYSALKPRSEGEARAMLDSWWGITDKAELESTLAWLDEEGHTAVYNRVLNELDPLTHYQRIERVQLAQSNSREEGIRFNIAHKYFYDLGPYTTRAFDVSRYVMLVKAGGAMGWYSNDAVWELITPKATSIINQQMFSSHQDYLLSYYVGRTFALHHGTGDIHESHRLINLLLSQPNSPFLTFVNWCDIIAQGSREGDQ